MLPDRLTEVIAPHLEGTIQEQSAVSGGCISNACRVQTTARSYFVKWSEGRAARTFEPEAEGLEALDAAGSPLAVPSAIAAQGATERHPGFLITEWMETGSQSPDFWEHFGRGLAALHRHVANQYGFERDNYIGELPQSNTQHDAWPSFVREERLAPQVRRAREQGRWQTSWDEGLEALYRKLPEIVPAKPPASILHGDLWKGNFMVTNQGTAALIDPAAYYGHREADLAMTELFGGFRPSFYEAYRSEWSLEPGYDIRKEVYNLYHLINHLNHFGAGYASSVRSTLQRFA